MSPRERDTNLNELIVDNDGGQLVKGTFSATGNWADAPKSGFAYKKAELRNGDHPFSDGTVLQANLSGKNDQATATATWKAAIPQDGEYAVYISYASLPNSTKEAKYRVHAADGTHDFTVNQKMGGGTWIYLGHFPMAATAGEQPIVELLNSGKNKKQVVTADAVKIGGGYGNVARIVKEPLDGIDYEYVTSGYPRFTEGARYFLQWAGAPDSVFTRTNYVNDYNDDYTSRALWVNWLAGGSSMLPAREGLNIPVDLSFAFHSDAGTTMNDSIIGTLGIYCTQGETLGNGSSRNASRDLTDLIMTDITNDIRANFEPSWTRRGMWDKSYYEARVPEVPCMLLELLSHQNFADMAYGLDPAFRFVVSRAVYKG
ncbi:MAG: xanthan lyase, partial [Muribaculaceae bacterium]|nr:xanthan lyase [Muribaculaceae bacterium]